MVVLQAGRRSSKRNTDQAEISHSMGFSRQRQVETDLMRGEGDLGHGDEFFSRSAGLASPVSAYVSKRNAPCLAPTPGVHDARRGLRKTAW